MIGISEAAVCKRLKKIKADLLASEYPGSLGISKTTRKAAGKENPRRWLISGVVECKM